MRLELEEIRAIAKLVQKKGLDQLVVESTDPEAPPCRLELRREIVVPSAPAQAAAADEIAEETSASVVDDNLYVVTSPTVGIFRFGDEGTKEGDVLEAGQVVGVVESLRVPNEVRLAKGGVVETILVKNGQGVEYGQPLLELRPGT